MKNWKGILLAALLAFWPECLPAQSQDTPSANVKGVTVSPSSYGGVDALGRRLPLSDTPAKPHPQKLVGMFYFLWHGEHGPTSPVYDISKIETATKDPGHHPEKFGAKGVYHWWGEPLFGYYTNRDDWVMRRHVELLTDAGVDFLVFDTTNSFTYDGAVFRMLNILLEYKSQGFKVPQVAFYTNTRSGETIAKIYNNIYKAHPKYEPLWFRLDGKPMIIGVKKDPAITQEHREFFRIKDSQWPNWHLPNGAFLNLPDGFPWMSFETPQHHYNAVRPSVMSVSVAQHCGTTTAFSASSFYGEKNNHTRGWHNGYNDYSPRALMGGANFQGQFNYAISKNPDMIFVTGWNEWIAGNWAEPNSKQPLLFVDCCDMPGSRDIEMMRGGYGDNYYMQLVANIRLFKGVDALPVDSQKRTIDTSNGFADWDTVSMRYVDYKGDTLPRHSVGYGGIKYYINSGRNDIIEVKVAHDSKMLYMHVKTAEALSPATDAKWMMCFIDTGRTETHRYAGYEFILNRISPSKTPEGNSLEAILEQRIADDGDSPTAHWQEAGRCPIQIYGNQLQISIPLAALGLDNASNACISFKWSDNQTDASIPEQETLDAFYIEGDAAPGGRMNYVYSW